ncbi:ABC transporter ATP-binding protein [Formosa haliotis]|uniref:ABC transporter ATP-binding protein n=1 Tax=Formosa haliotis TaxID=1555194 RepID=UPI0008253695|nr:ABC transporter ATP-binding protein [Formosa haliotis]
MKPAIKVENLSKQYRLGTVGTGTFAHDVNRWWHTVRGKEDPYLKIGEANDRTSKGNSEYVWALQDINFEVKQGEVLGIIGKNGAGKSTLLKLLSRVTAPTTGSIKARGRIASLLEVGTGFHPELTGRENVFLNGAIMGMTKPEIRSKFDEIVAFAGCERYIDTPVKRYSSGMYVRLAFAVAAHLEPEILIVDEVLAVGDAEFQKKAIGKMKEVSQGGGRTVLFVSHNMASIEQLCDSCVLMENGSIKSVNTTSKVIEQYISMNLDKSSVSWKDRNDRKGDKKVLFEGISLFNNDNKKIDSVLTGQDLRIKISYSAIDKFSFNRVKISLGLRDSKGVLLFSCPSDIFNVGGILGLKGHLNLNIPNFPLPEGVYTYNIFIEVDKMVSDWIQEAGIITVVGGDFYKTGKLPPKSHPGVLINYNWEVLNK